ncbi:hypothetical protein B6U99_01680 [Candidatus Geothermarchaeota archaeon ex4572_27]|nr:MAG: hypothetical protein B6U99_01680 [Candidatus Geothermarchaeota archaeon ex4572_27]
MAEPLPALDRGRVVLVASSADVTRLADYDSGCSRWYLWSGDAAYDVTEHAREGVLRAGGYYLNLERLLGGTPQVFCRTVGSIEEYVGWLAEGLLGKIEGKKLMLSYSGGKDSTAALAVLLRLMERASFRLHVVHVHMPYIEPEDNVRFVEFAARRLGVDIEVVEPSRAVMRRYLLEEGLPYRRGRWCTYLKTRPLKVRAKRGGVDILVIGDRALEAGKRFHRLMGRLVSGQLLKGKKLYIIAPLTVVDVVSMAKECGVVHPDYLAGITRVSCYYCPYRSVFELMLVRPRLEDEGLVEEAMRREWRRWYSDIPWEDFKLHHLWRYIPKMARAMLRVKEAVSKACEAALGLDDMRRLNSSIWLDEIEAPLLGREALVRAVAPP